MVDKIRPGGPESNESNPDSLDERIIEGCNNPDNGMAPPDEPGEINEAPARPNYMVLGFGVVAVVIALVVSIVLFSGQGAAETPAPSTLSQAATEGKVLFQANNCATCHLADGRAGGTGPRLSTTGKNDQTMTNIIRRGRGSMPPNPRLAEEEVKKIITYIREIKPPAETKT
ncbi:MAG: hypothetical protein JWP00_4319 [Chloroflexi bacterium]|jgi:mono/diheme cytochrome c family protein|nr:hypothetical protein [Chloroflexota bacterium]